MASLDWGINHFDIKTALLHGKLTEGLYMEQLEGRKEKGKETWVCKLHKSLYGLCQAGCKIVYNYLEAIVIIYYNNILYVKMHVCTSNAY